ncbi:MAG: 16S rRNA (cytosine(1402)-N(4))-methyltransferase RsmH [Patescibacteria group bacterium]
MSIHTPVLTEKVLEYLDPHPNENILDCTAGGGGHTFVLADRIAPKGKVLALDWDPETIQTLKEEIKKRKLGQRVLLENENFAHLKEAVQRNRFQPVAGILFDLGFSSDQIESQNRGFSFQREGPLNMRYSPQNPVTAEKLLNWSSKAQLEEILKEYGEEQFAKQIAQALVESRAQKHLQKTSQLVRIVKEATPKWYHRKKIHPATKTFQALRLTVNNELENLKQGLRDAADVLAPQGKIAVISFHSLEDRIVKEFFKQASMLKPITKKPITPSVAEIRKNPRARSAKLRVAIKQ